MKLLNGYSIRSARRIFLQQGSRHQNLGFDLCKINCVRWWQLDSVDCVVTLESLRLTEPVNSRPVVFGVLVFEIIFAPKRFKMEFRFDPLLKRGG